MRISIITICYNNERDIEPTIESVLNQTYKNIEYILIDGASSDNTLEIINNYKDRVSKIVSEPDKNLYDAINKGIKMATGDIVGLIHAGDRLYDNEVIKKIAKCHLNYKIDISYGNSKLVNSSNKSIRINKSPAYKRSLVRRGWMPSHQSIYAKRNLFEKYGYYRTDLGGIADYEWFIRYFYANGLRIKRIDVFIIKFSLGGMSTSNYSNRLKRDSKNKIKKCWEINGLKPPLSIVYLKWLRKPKQFLLALFD